MPEQIPNGFFCRDLIVFNHLRRGGYVAKGFIFEAPDLTNSPVADLNDFQDQLCLLQPLMFVERRQQEAELILKIVQVGDRAVREVGCFKDETLGHIAAAPEMIEHNQITSEKAIGCVFKHMSDVDGFDGDAGRAIALNAEHEFAERLTFKIGRAHV